MRRRKATKSWLSPSKSSSLLTRSLLSSNHYRCTTAIKKNKKNLLPIVLLSSDYRKKVSKFDSLKPSLPLTDKEDKESVNDATNFEIILLRETRNKLIAFSRRITRVHTIVVRKLQRPNHRTLLHPETTKWHLAARNPCRSSPLSIVIDVSDSLRNNGPFYQDLSAVRSYFITRLTLIVRRARHISIGL